jgi:hypothetical protein
MRHFSRREFLVVGGSAALVAVGTALPGSTRAVASSTQNHIIYRLSLRGARGSRAAKLHNANKRFANAAAANLHRAHPGDRSRIVGVVVNDSTFRRLFPSPGVEVADLRTVTLGCIGDCDRSSQVSVDEIVTMISRALGTSPETACGRGDLNRDLKITVDEIVTALNNALQGCS